MIHIFIVFIKYIFDDVWCRKFSLHRVYKYFFLLIFFRLLLDLISGKKPVLKTFNDVQALLKQGKRRETKLIIRENDWPLSSTIRSQLWPALCDEHRIGKNMLDGFYWEMVNQVGNNKRKL